MTFNNDFQIKCKDDYEVWDAWLKFLGIHNINNREPLPDLLRHIYCMAMTIPHDEPFKGNGMHELRKSLNKREFNGKLITMTNATFAAYKRNIKAKGWLNEDGSLIKSIKDMKKQYNEDVQKGIKSISLIYKICVC